MTEEKKKIELKPCPFCGGKADLITLGICFNENMGATKQERYELRVSVELRCTVCRMSGGNFISYIGIDPETAETRHSVYESVSVERMARRWNRRADDDRREAD